MARLLREYKENPTSICKCTTWVEWGFPCEHWLRVQQCVGKPLELSDIDNQWHLTQEFSDANMHLNSANNKIVFPTNLLISDPEIINGRGRPKDKKSTKRFPSGFELAERALKKKKKK
jgi:hypothetical protein